MRPRVLLIGVGNEDRGDDALGLLVARRIRGTPGIDVIEHRGEATGLIEAWQSYELVCLVDAVHSGAVPGTLWQLDLRQETLPSASNTSSHGFGVAEAVELARVLAQMPEQLCFFGVEAARFDIGQGLSEVAQAACVALEERILFFLKADRCAAVSDVEQ